MPSFIIFVLVLCCLLAGMALLAVFRVDGENRTVNGMLIGVASVVGLALLLNCRTWWQVTDSVLHSQRKRLHSAANRLHKLKSEGFMKVSHHTHRTARLALQALHPKTLYQNFMKVASLLHLAGYSRLMSKLASTTIS